MQGMKPAPAQLCPHSSPAPALPAPNPAEPLPALGCSRLTKLPPGCGAAVSSCWDPQLPEEFQLALPAGCPQDPVPPPAQLSCLTPPQPGQPLGHPSVWGQWGTALQGRERTEITPTAPSPPSQGLWAAQRSFGDGKCKRSQSAPSVFCLFHQLRNNEGISTAGSTKRWHCLKGHLWAGPRAGRQREPRNCITSSGYEQGEPNCSWWGQEHGEGTAGRSCRKGTELGGLSFGKSPLLQFSILCQKPKGFESHSQLPPSTGSAL